MPHQITILGIGNILWADEGFGVRVVQALQQRYDFPDNISLVDGGQQKRAFTYVDDGIAALMKIIDNKDGIASGKIYNIGNPVNNFSIRDLADMMLKLACEYPEYRESAQKVNIIETTAAAYYGKGYQDVQNRVPKITNTCEELNWAPTINMADTLRNIFDAYRGQVGEARKLMD